MHIAPHSVAKDLLLHAEDNQLSDAEIAYLSGSLIGAGSDTVSQETDIESDQAKLTCRILDRCRDFDSFDGCCAFSTFTGSCA
jgi:hypothetical protein